MAEEQQFCWFILLNFKVITFSLYCSYFFLPTFSDPHSQKSFLPLYNYLDCVPALHLDSRWFLLGYLSHHCLVGGGRVGYRLWGHYSGVILPLMRQVELVQCIKREGDGCFIWKPPPSLACMSLLPSLAFNPMALVVCTQSPEEHLLLGLLRWAVFLGFSNWVGPDRMGPIVL